MTPWSTLGVRIHLNWNPIRLSRSTLSRRRKITCLPNPLILFPHMQMYWISIPLFSSKVSLWSLITTTTPSVEETHSQSDEEETKCLSLETAHSGPLKLRDEVRWTRLDEVSNKSRSIIDQTHCRLIICIRNIHTSDCGFCRPQFWSVDQLRRIDEWQSRRETDLLGGCTQQPHIIFINPLQNRASYSNLNTECHRHSPPQKPVNWII